jgi:hypothetical protein
MSYVDIPGMEVPHPRLSDIIAPEEEGKTYIGPNIDWPKVPQFLSEILNLMDPGGMLTTPAVMPMVAPEAAATYAKPGAKAWMESLIDSFTGIEKNPNIEKLTGKAKLLFREPGATKTPMVTDAPKNLMESSALPEEFLSRLTKEQRTKWTDVMAFHEGTHWWQKNPQIYEQVNDILNRAPTEVWQTIAVHGMPKKEFELITAKYPEQLQSKIVSEFLPYAQEATKYGESSLSTTARRLYELGAANPEIKAVLDEVSKIQPLSEGTKETIEMARKTGKWPWEAATGKDQFLMDDIRRNMQADMQRTIQKPLKGGKVGSKTGGGLIAEPPPPKSPEVAFKEAQAKGRTKIYSPKEGDPGLGGAYTTPEQPQSIAIDPNVAWIEDLLGKSGLKGQKLTDLEKKLWDIVRTKKPIE